MVPPETHGILKLRGRSMGEEPRLPPKGVGECPLQVATNNGRNAAHRAARTGGLGMLRAMSELGCPISEKDHKGWLPTHVAGQEGRVDALRLLTRMGCPIEAKGGEGWTAAHLAAKEGHEGGPGDAPRHQARRHCAARQVGGNRPGWRVFRRSEDRDYVDIWEGY